MPAYHADLFPVTVSYGAKGGAGFNTGIIVSDSGAEERISRWANARHAYDVACGIKSLSDLLLVKQHHLARKGSAASFPYWDPADNTSHPLDPSYLGVPGTRDQLIGIGTGGQTSFQLTKTYISGPTSYTRTIRKIKLGSVRIWVNGALVSSGWSVDLETGVILFTVAPALNATIHASFEFYVPVRYGEEADKVLSASIDSFSEGSIDSIPLVEDMYPGPGPYELPTMGAYEASLAANFTLSWALGRLYVFQATISGLTVFLPDPAAYPPGSPLFVIQLEGAQNLAIKDHALTTLLTLTPNNGIEIGLSIQTAGAKVWLGY